MANNRLQVGVDVALDLAQVTNNLTQQFNQSITQISQHLTQNTFVQALDQVEDSAFKVQDALSAVAQKVGAFIGDALKSLEKIKPGPDALGVVTGKQVLTAKAYQQAMKGLEGVLQAVQIRIGLGVAPKLTELTTRFLAFIGSNKVLIGDGLGRTVELLSEALDALDNFAQAIDVVIRSTIGWKSALLILGGVLAWVGRASLVAFATNPVTWITAAIAALILLVDDFMTYLEGGESALGSFWEPFKVGLEVVGVALAAFKTLFDAFWAENGALVQAFADGLLVAIGASISNLINLFKGLFALLTGDFDGLRAAFDGWLEGIKAQFAVLAELFGETMDWLGFGEDTVEFKRAGQMPVFNLSRQAEQIAGKADRIQAGVQGAQTLAAGALVKQSTAFAGSQTQNYNQTVSIQVSGDEPRQIGERVAESVARQQQRLATRNNSSPFKQ